MNRCPTDAQWLVLYQVDDGDVWLDGDGRWRAKSERASYVVTGIINRLHQLGLVEFPSPDTIKVTGEGVKVLHRRSVYDTLDRLNRRGSR